MKRYSDILKTEIVKTKTINEDIEDVIDPVGNIMDITPEVKEKSNEPTLSEIITDLLTSREITHIVHLSVKNESGSNAMHLALGEYYTNIVDLIDTLVETYQGKYGLCIDTLPCNADAITPDTIIEYLSNLAKRVEANRFRLIKPEDSFIQTVFDDILTLMYRTLYKLNNLK